MSILDPSYFAPIGQTASDAFNGLISRNDGFAEPKRSAMVFTSTLRQLVKSTQPSTSLLSNSILLASPTDSTILSPLGNLQTSANITTVINPTALNSSTISGYLPNSTLQSIPMALNPKSVKFSQPKRFTKKDTLNGSTFFHFTNSKGQNNDLMTISFVGNTGNLDYRSAVGTSSLDAITKLRIWHNLYLLTREPMVLANGIENEFRITYASQLLPLTIDFIGFFTKVLDFSEVAEKPFSREYSMDFIVKRTDPDLDTYLDVLSTITTVGNPSAAPGSNTPTIASNSPEFNTFNNPNIA
jgi:hypothetical protein